MALSFVDDLARLAGNPDLLAIAQLAHPDPGGLTARGVHQHDVGEVDRTFALDDTALADLLGRALMPLDHVDPFDDHGVSPPHVRDCHLRPQITSGASDMILVNCLSRSSRATGPKMRVPTGLSSAFKSTTAFLSKRM